MPVTDRPYSSCSSPASSSVGAALIVEALYHPPYWVHAVLWLPLILVVTLGPLRPMKGLMIALQYHHKAAEQKFGGGGDVR